MALVLPWKIGARSKSKTIEPAERTGFPPAYSPAQEFLAGLLLYLTLKKIAELSPEELFKLLQVAAVRMRARLRRKRLPIRNLYEHLVPGLPKCGNGSRGLVVTRPLMFK
jgi:hypothetical protein